MLICFIIIIYYLGLFHPTNDIVPTWLLSNTTPPTTNDSIASASPPLSNNNSSHPLETISTLTTIKTELDNNDDQKLSAHKKKKQKKQHPNKNMKNDDSTQQINQLSPTTPNSNMMTTPLSLPPQLSQDALRSFVQKYICEKYGERSVVILTSRVAQKSYGTEKR